jgi:hypothetical protein
MDDSSRQRHPIADRMYRQGSSFLEQIRVDERSENLVTLGVEVKFAGDHQVSVLLAGWLIPISSSVR